MANNRIIKPTRRVIRGQAGISLVELMISITLGLIILAALTTLFVNNSSTRREIERSAGVLENGRYALSVLKDELSLAGFYGTLASVSGSMANPCSHTVADWASSLGFHAYGSNNAADATWTCATPLPTRKGNTDAILIQRASTCVAGVSGCQAKVNGEAYLQVSECGDEYVTTPSVLDLGSSTTFTLKKLQVTGSTVSCAAAGTAPLRRFYRSLYYVDQTNNLTRADFIPNGTFSTTVLAEGVENMQLQYGFDTNNDGTPDQFATSPPGGATWADAMGVRVWLLVRAPTATPGYVNDKTFVLDDISIGPADLGASDQAFKRHVFSSYIGFSNPARKRFQ